MKKLLLLSTFLLGGFFNSKAQSVQFTVKATALDTLEVYMRPDANIMNVVTGISNCTFVLQIPQTFSNPQGLWTVIPNSTYLGAVSSNSATSTLNGSMHNTLFSWTSNPNIAGADFLANTEYLLATIATPTGVDVDDVTVIDWGNNRLNDAIGGMAPIWATSLAIDGTDATNNTTVFYGNSTTNTPANSGTTTVASSLVINGGPLSIRNLVFTGQMKNYTTELTWNVDAEKNMDRYEVEYSMNATAWEKIGSVQSENKERVTYHFTHKLTTANNVNFYRLKLIENNSISMYSNVIELKNNEANTGITLAPNIVKAGESIRISNNSTDPVTQLKVLDETGKLVMNITTGLSSSSSIPTDKLATGQYFVMINNGPNTSVLRFTIF